MSKANSVIKVLRTALKRVEKRWGKNNWSVKGSDGNYYVCLEGAITGGCQLPTTQVQRDALELLRGIVKERTGIDSIPGFNDAAETTKDDILEVIKLGIIRIETGDDEQDEMLEEIDSLLDSEVRAILDDETG